MAQQITGMGYAAVSVNYRLALNAQGRFPAAVEDLRSALNTDKIIALGQSAGAHLAAEIALTV